MLVLTKIVNRKLCCNKITEIAEIFKQCLMIFAKNQLATNWVVGFTYAYNVLFNL